MGSTETANVRVSVNGTEAEDHLNALYNSAKKFKKELEAAWKTGDPSKIKIAEKNFKSATKEVNKYEKQLFTVDKVLRNLGGSSINDLKRAQKELNRELNSGAIERNSADWARLTTKLRKVDSELMKVRSEMKQTQSFVAKMNAGFNKYFMLIGTFAASVLGIIMNLRKAVDASNEFESSVANLSALTGLVGEELNWLKEKALAFSGSITESGMRVTKSAQSIVDAYTQMGSKRPELLKDKEALAGVTEQALILSQAAKMELVPATLSLAISMNQFNADAKDAGRYINVIAAGSKIGAGNVEYQAATLEKAGTAIKLAGLEIEEGVAAVETIAPYFSQPTKAGTQLKNVMINLQMGADKFNPKIVGMATALDNLSEANLTVTQLTKLFGKENLNAGQVLITNKETYKEYLAAVTNTNVATEQSVINTATNTAKLEAARAKLAKYVIMLGSKLAPALTFSTSSFSYMVKAIMASIKFFNEHKRTITVVTVAIVTYTLAVNANVIATKLQTLWTNTLAKSSLKLFKTIMSNPYAALAAVIMAGVTALVLFAKRTADVNAAQKAVNEVKNEAKKAIVEERVELEYLLMVARDEKQSKADRIAAIKKINQLSPEYLGGITLEQINTEKATAAIDKHIKSLENQARVQAAKEKLVEIEKQLIDLQEQGTGAGLKWYQVLANSVTAFGSMSKMAENNVKSILNNAAKLTEDLLARKEALLGIATEIPEDKKVDDDGSGDSPDADPVTKYGDIIAELEAAHKEKLNELREDYLNGTLLTKEEFDAEMLLSEIAFLEAKRILAESYSEETIELDTLILQKKISAYDADLAAKKKVIDAKAKLDATAKLASDKQAEKDKKDREAELKEKIKTIERFQSVLGSSVESFIEGNEDALRQGAKTMIFMVLDLLKSQVRVAQAAVTVQSLAQPDSIMTFGASGLARAAIINGLIEVAFGAVKGLISGAMSSKQKKPEVNQNFSGRYPVIGAEDKKEYNARYLGNVNTGVIRGASLVSDHGDEMIIDGPTTKNLVFNYPDIVQGIKNLSMGVNPSFAKMGNSTTPDQSIPDNNGDPILRDLIYRLIETLEKPLSIEKVDFPMHEFKKAEKEYNEIEDFVKTN